MPIFIILSISLTYLVQTVSPLPAIFSSPEIVQLGITLAVCFILLNQFKKLTPGVSYDLFASSTLLAWFAYWKPLFNPDSPIFFFFPLYFAILTALVTVFFSGKQVYIDGQSLQQMLKIAEKSRLKPWLLMICVLGSLQLTEHYLLYPVTMTLLILRFALSSCLEQK